MFGHLFQVEYALEAVNKGATAVGIRGQDVVVLGVEKKSTAKLQESRTVRKILKLDAHLCLAFAGLTADARVLVNRARIECQSYRLSVEDACSVEYVSRFIARLQQRYTQRGGRRPFGISTLVCGHDVDGSPHLYQTDPSGTYSEWKANAIGRNAKTVREYLQKVYEEKETKAKETKEPVKEAKTEQEEDAGPMLTEAECIKLTIQSLLEVVESGSKNIEIAVMRRRGGLEFLEHDAVSKIVAEIEEEKEKLSKAKKGKKNENASDE